MVFSLSGEQKNVAFMHVKKVLGLRLLGYVQTVATTPNNVGSCKPTMLRPLARGEKFDRCQTFRNNTQHHATGCANGRSM